MVGNDPVNQWDLFGLTVITYEPKLISGGALNDVVYATTPTSAPQDMAASISIVPRNDGVAANAFAAAGWVDSYTETNVFVSCDDSGNISYADYSRSEPESGSANDRGMSALTFTMVRQKSKSNGKLELQVNARAVTSSVNSLSILPGGDSPFSLDILVSVVNFLGLGTETYRSAVRTGTYKFECVCEEGP
jgi:hypothetical protein